MTTSHPLLPDFLECSGACTDTRSISKDSMFFALKGPNFDANSFALEALEKGARCAVVDDAGIPSSDRIIHVPDVLLALQDLARAYRRRYDIPVIAITGSNGKTTTKELIHAVLERDRPTLATTGNLNNHIGVPLTLLRLEEKHRIAIIEMGANKVGDIAELTAIAEPTHGMITNIGKAHLEGFGGYEGVVKAKTEMYAFIDGQGGTLFVHAEDELLMQRSEGIDRITYGRTGNAGTSGDAVGAGPFLEVAFAGKDGNAYHVNTKLIGSYNLPNVMAAVAIGQHFGVADQDIAEALTAYTPSNNRSQFIDTGRNHVIMDAYNANPSSMKAALENFAGMASERKKVAIIGGMKELGDASSQEHRAIIDLVDRSGLEAIYVGSEFMEHAGPGLNVYPDAASALRELGNKPLLGHLVLVKGSRGTALEKLIPAL